ncbi:HI0074 family nucleotidyltransferase substrate-binding subunit [uncultured Megasphaera sp.]|uniref:HI0074 family nucleotidyltransferase substrate-binding subunit n=1 Tax=uncultured Megasphaera sp. TaxID=165188 RepID=UPI00261F8EB6|nr:HI0074 family nucleotidyltransferase substrate-binding subunit [uncultured Megasphaera sp.]
MKKMDNFLNCLDVLKQADFSLAAENEIYRTGIVGQFNLTFELAWKALQQVLRVHGVQEAETGSPREILQLGYKVGFIEDASVWLLMLKKRNLSGHLYNEAEIDELLILIRDKFIPAFGQLGKTLQQKLAEVEEDH